MSRTSPGWSSGAYLSSNRPGPEREISCLELGLSLWMRQTGTGVADAGPTMLPMRAAVSGPRVWTRKWSQFLCGIDPRVDVINLGGVSEPTHGPCDGLSTVPRCGHGGAGFRAPEERAVPLAPRNDGSGLIRLLYVSGTPSSASPRGSRVSTSSSPVIWKSRRAIGVGA
jgi:hypothetical protein